MGTETRVRAGLLAALAGAGVVLYFHDPRTAGFFPKCMVNYLTGIHCPGCGTGRGLYALLHGDVAQAFAYNPLMVVALPLLVAGLVWGIVLDLRGRPQVRVPVWFIIGVGVVVVVFTVLRNIPGPPFDVLAPHALE